MPRILAVHGVFLTLLVYGSNRQTAELVRWLPRPRPRRPDLVDLGLVVPRKTGAAK